jgi:predicted HAD superfamily Cof-like phosphohydrolase
MNKVLQDQKQFMTACGQTVDTYNHDQFHLYKRLIGEEVSELIHAIQKSDRTEQLDALIDILVVTAGAIHSLGVDGESAWDEVMRTNFAKVDPVTGLVKRREDGKILKPDGWQPPNLAQFVKNV